VPKIIAAAKAVPPYDIPQNLAIEFARRHFGPHYKDMDRLLKIFESARVNHRQFCVPSDWFSTPKTFKEKNDTYIEWACRLGAEAAQNCIQMAGLTVDEIDHIIFVSSTGLATPSIDARLIEPLGLNPHIKRTPIWGLGCVGGAMGLSRAADFVKADQKSKVLLVAVELCGLTFQFHDLDKSNLVAAALFGDGAAAAIVSADGDGPEIIASRSMTWPDSLGVMGWNILDEGMQVVFAKAIPAIVREHSRKDIDNFLSRFNLTLDDISHFLIHPGGAKVVDAYKAALCLGPGKLGISEEVLRDHGNMSSVTVLYILDQFVKCRKGVEARGNSFGLIAALGPGFSSELILFKS
jgi:alkylresorcinol/alkylpyrone synthase